MNTAAHEPVDPETERPANIIDQGSKPATRIMR